MLKRITNLIKQDLTNSLRDNLILYVIAAPLILAVLARIFLPGVENMKLTFAVHREVDSEIIESLEEYADVEVYEAEEALYERINRSDDVPGVIKEDAGVSLVLEGNESLEAKEGYSAILEKVMSDEEVIKFIPRSLGGGRSYLKEYVAIILIMLATLLGGMVVGFNMVDDTYTKAVKALAVSPLPLRDYMIAKAVFSMLQGFVVGFLTTLILMGLKIPVLKLLIAFIASTPLGVILGFFMASMADNQISAIGAGKIIMPLYLTIPVVAIFLPFSRQWVFFIFPNYWMFTMFKNIFLDTQQIVGFSVAVLITALCGVFVDILFMPRLRKKFSLR